MELERIKIIPALLVIGLFSMIAGIGMNSPFTTGEASGLTPPVTTALGETMFTDFLAAFEMIDILLVAALIAGVYLAKREKEEMEAVKEAVKSKPQVEATEAEESMGESESLEVKEDGSS
ncbi:MAG: hypothetical protein SXQ77_03345 [Halobacteria archaeon]|nr:hypothetical protein [Halobacteria archaeon]